MKTKLIILCGIPFAGKTTLARKIVRLTGAEHIDLDEVKVDLFGKSIRDEELSQKDWDKIYQRMYSLIEKALKEGRSVIHDTGNFTKQERIAVKQIADKLGIQTLTIFLDISPALARQRLLENRSTGKRFDITDEAFNSAVEEMEVPQADENPLIFREGDDLNEWVKANFSLK